MPVPVFGICLGHQMLALAPAPDHQDASGPPRRQPSGQARLAEGVVEITSMNHGFAVDAQPCPRAWFHRSLFDGSNAASRSPAKRPSR
jgi:carbamoyl-phosphate synthase small subunit